MKLIVSLVVVVSGASVLADAQPLTSTHSYEQSKQETRYESDASAAQRYKWNQKLIIILHSKGEPDRVLDERELKEWAGNKKLRCQPSNSSN